MHPIPLSSPSVTNIKTIDCGEAIIPIVSRHRLRIDDSPANNENLGYPHVFLLRKTVAEKLYSAAELLTDDRYLLVKETLRPASFQAFIFNRRKNRLSNSSPELTEEELITITSKFIAPPWVAGHPTGGAFDVTLCDAQGNECDLGCGYDEDEHSSDGRCFSYSSTISEIAKNNREELFRVLNAQGFINYPFEWWHWSYGDMYWAALSHHPHAIYGPIPEIASTDSPSS